MNNPFAHPPLEEDKAEREARRLKLRSNLLITLFCAVLAGFMAVLYQTQIVHGDDYLVSTNTHITETEQVNSVRGDILDTYGRTLVTNEVSYNVELDWDAMGSRRVEILTRLLEICREEGVEWADSLPITESAPWAYTTDTPLSYATENDEGEPVTKATLLGLLAKKCGWVKDPAAARLTAGQLLSTMCQSFGVTEKQTRPRLETPSLRGTLAAAGQALRLDDQGGSVTRSDRALAGVLYELYLRQHSISNTSYVFARGVDITFITKVREGGLDGVRIETATARRYETHYAAHVLGYTGAITEASKDRYKELGYPMNATVGRDGVELAFEERLHGASGTRLMEKDVDGNIISQEWQTEPEPGENAVLTIDIALQSTTEDLLAQYAAQQEEPGGLAAAVVDMTGGVLALASYPSYDMTTFWDDYADLANDTDGRPLVNRAVKGLYSPGSTFKMLTAVAALSTGTISTTDKVECTGKYTYYTSPQPRCAVYPGRHGYDNVTKAITDSCNVFFFDVGRRTGIATLDKYAEQFGLGQYTGVELAEEQGTVAGPETSARFDQPWYDGDTLNAAIGQGNHQFTPLQLANYVATLVNGGNHYQCHLLKEYKSSDYSQVTEAYEPKLLNTIDIEPQHLSAIMKGMYDLSKTARMVPAFSSLPVSVGCKTGTAEVATKAANAVFVCFAPYEDPQVALCLVAEQGESGRTLASVAGGILAQYFSTGSSLSTVSGENTLLR